MRTVCKFLVALIVSVVIAGCDSPQSTLDRLQKEIAAYSAGSSEEDLQSIQSGFAKLDTEIQNLEAHGKTAQARDLRDARNTLQVQFTSARVAVGLTKVQSAVRGIGDAVKQVGQEMEQALQAPKDTPANAPAEP